MPLIDSSKYQKPGYFVFSDMETIMPSIFNRVNGVQYDREKLVLNDGDFWNLDWLKKGHNKLVILSHGMEGASDRHYVVRFAKYFHQRGWDALAWNYRGCGGELNLLPKTYYYGSIDDYSEVLNHVLAKDQYDHIILVGFSMGGCLVNKYLGANQNLDQRIRGAISFSVSCDLRHSIQKVERQSMNPYRLLFFNKIMGKLRAKIEAHEELKDVPVNTMSTFEDYLKGFVLKYHGLESVDQFYQLSSCKNYFESITVPSLIVNAQNDPILAGDCYPYELVKPLEYLYLETPKNGGHLGFTLAGKKYSWMEIRAKEFIDQKVLAGQ